MYVITCSWYLKIYSNCTNVGLKSMRKFCTFLWYISILIAPMWDWNIKKWIYAWILLHSNCTNVGLKCFFHPNNRVIFGILIAPMWDWNYHRCCQILVLASSILIAPMWDWNKNSETIVSDEVLNSNCTNVGLKLPICNLLKHCINANSNCTNVGLKWKIIFNYNKYFIFILIAPMWDWNVPVRPHGHFFYLILIAPMWDWNLV